MTYSRTLAEDDGGEQGRHLTGARHRGSHAALLPGLLLQFIEELQRSFTASRTNNLLFSILQITILYIALGPGPIKRIDLSHLLYGDTWSWLLYAALLATSVLSVGISFSKVAVDISWNESSPILKFHNQVEGPDQGLLLRPSPYDLCICDQYIKSGKGPKKRPSLATGKTNLRLHISTNLHVAAAGVRVQAGGLQHPLLAVPQAPAHDHLKVLYSELLSVYHC